MYAGIRRIARGLKKFVIDSAEPFIIDFKYCNEAINLQSSMRTITAVNGYGIVAPTLIQYHGEQSPLEVRGQAMDRPIMTTDAANRYGLVTAFLSKYYGGGYVYFCYFPDVIHNGRMICTN